jgi:hypothetical protein
VDANRQLAQQKETAFERKTKANAGPGSMREDAGQLEGRPQVLRSGRIGATGFLRTPGGHKFAAKSSINTHPHKHMIWQEVWRARKDSNL